MRGKLLKRKHAEDEDTGNCGHEKGERIGPPLPPLNFPAAIGVYTRQLFGFGFFGVLPVAVIANIALARRLRKGNIWR